MINDDQIQVIISSSCYSSLIIKCIINLYIGVNHNYEFSIQIIHGIINLILMFFSITRSKHPIHSFLIVINTCCIFQIFNFSENHTIQFLLTLYWMLHIYFVFQRQLRLLMIGCAFLTLIQLIIQIILTFNTYVDTLVECHLIFFLFPLLYILRTFKDFGYDQSNNELNQSKFQMLNKLAQASKSIQQKTLLNINIESSVQQQKEQNETNILSFNCLFNQIPLGIIILSEELNPILINNRALNLLKEMNESQSELQENYIKTIKKALRSCINKFLDPSKSIKLSQENIKRQIEKMISLKFNSSFKSSQKIEKFSPKRAITEINKIDQEDQQQFYSIQFCQKNIDEIEDPINYIINYQAQANKNYENQGYYQIQSLKNQNYEKQLKDLVLEQVINIKKNGESKKKILRYNVFKDFFQGSQPVIVILIENATHKHKIINRELKYQFQNMLLNSFSHELKTPLNCSMQLLELLSTILPNQEYVENYVTPSLISMKLLYYQLNDILDYASFESKCFQYHYKTFSIKNLLIECKDYYKEAIKAKMQNIQVRVDFSFEIVNDPDRIMQVLINLMNNSIKFTNTGGEISLESKYSKKKKGLIVISVRDNGIGIKSQQLNVLKQNLYHDSYSGESLESFVNNYNQVFTGLGLKIANKIVQGLVDSKDHTFDNQLQISSLENQFTRIKFYVQNFANQKQKEKKELNQEDYFESFLPSDQSESIIQKIDKLNRQLEEQQIFQNNKSNKCMCAKILVVDDVPFNHQAIKILLNFFNFPCDSSFDGEEAVKKVKEKFHNPCCVECRKGYLIILMDIEMPVMNGYDASYQIKQFLDSQKHFLTKIVMCSAYDTFEHRQEALLNGIDDFLPKPIKKQALQEILSVYT